MNAEVDAIELHSKVGRLQNPFVPSSRLLNTCVGLHAGLLFCYKSSLYIPLLVLRFA
jgi:hypothetical protein